MSDFEHKQFTREWFTARYDNGEFVYDDDYVATDNHEFGHSGVEASHIPITIYRAVAIEVPWRRAYWDAESESVETCDIEGCKDPQGAKIERLQSAVREMLESLNALEYSRHSTRNNLGAYKPSTIETYGLTQGDME